MSASVDPIQNDSNLKIRSNSSRILECKLFIASKIPELLECQTSVPLMDNISILRIVTC